MLELIDSEFRTGCSDVCTVRIFFSNLNNGNRKPFSTCSLRFLKSTFNTLEQLEFKLEKKILGF